MQSKFHPAVCWGRNSFQLIEQRLFAFDVLFASGQMKRTRSSSSCQSHIRIESRGTIAQWEGWFTKYCQGQQWKHSLYSPTLIFTWTEQYLQDQTFPRWSFNDRVTSSVQWQAYCLASSCSRQEKKLFTSSFLWFWKSSSKLKLEIGSQTDLVEGVDYPYF